MNETIHARIRRLRIASGLSFSQIAERIGAGAPQSVQNWERTNEPTAPRLHMVAPLARTLGVTADYLLTGEEPPTRDRE